MDLALKQSLDLDLFKINNFLTIFWEVPGSKTQHYVHEKEGFDSQIQKIQKYQFL